MKTWCNPENTFNPWILLLLGVHRHQGRIIYLEYTGEGDVQATHMFVGKVIGFDVAFTWNFLLLKIFNNFYMVSQDDTLSFLPFPPFAVNVLSSFFKKNKL